MLPVRWGQGVTTPDVARAALDGDGDGLAVVHRVAEYLGKGLGVLADLFNPEVIVIGSMAVRLGEVLLAPAREAMRREALQGAYDACRVVPAQLGERLGDVAALCAALQALRPITF